MWPSQFELLLNVPQAAVVSTTDAVDTSRGKPRPVDPKRTVVAARYRALQADRESDPDKIFLGGSDLKDLDPSMALFSRHLVVLDENLGEHPRAWSMTKKIQTTVSVGLFCFLSPFASTTFVPSIHLVMADLHITDSTIGALQVSAFLFAYATGPLFLAPLSELYGRSIVQHTGNTIFMAFTLGGGFAQTPTQLAICRFLAGIGGSAGIAIVGGVIADLWDLAARPKAQGLIMLGPIIGPIIGPVCGGWMSEGASWRWTMWVPAIAAAILGMTGLLTLHESYAPTVLLKKMRRERVKRLDGQLYTVLDLNDHPSNMRYLISRLARPVLYLLIDPALFFSSLYYSVIWGTAYLVIVTYADVFGSGYHQSVGIIGTDFLAMGLGIIVATFATIKAQEVIFAKRNESGRNYTPESRLLSCAPGALLCAGGLFMYGFTVLKTHFIVPLVGVFFFSMGSLNIIVGQPFPFPAPFKQETPPKLTSHTQMAIQIYAIDGFGFSASAVSTLNFFRCVFSGAFPLFGAKLFDALGLDWGVALLAFICLGVGVPFVPLLYLYGARLRKIGVRNMARFLGSQEMDKHES